jgi:hypothetical protein
MKKGRTLDIAKLKADIEQETDIEKVKVATSRVTTRLQSVQ